MFFRLAPFIIISYFTLQSVLNQDLKGIIYLIGLIVVAAITILISNILGLTSTNLDINRNTVRGYESTQTVCVLVIQSHWTTYVYTVTV